MAFTLAEAFADLAPVVSFADRCRSLIQAVPPKETAKPSDYIKCAAAILAEAAPLADTVAAQIKD